MFFGTKNVPQHDTIWFIFFGRFKHLNNSITLESQAVQYTPEYAACISISKLMVFKFRVDDFVPALELARTEAAKNRLRLSERRFTLPVKRSAGHSLHSPDLWHKEIQRKTA